MPGVTIEYYLRKPLKDSTTINRKLARQLWQILRSVTPVKTGRMKRSWVISRYTRNGFTISNSTYYLDYVENGTANITPRYFVRRGLVSFNSKASNILPDDIEKLYRAQVDFT